MTLYAMRFGQGAIQMPPETTSCISTFSSYSDGNKKRVLKFNSPQHPYTILVGVCGRRGVRTGAFTLTVRVGAGASSTTHHAAAATTQHHSAAATAHSLLGGLRGLSKALDGVLK